MTMHPSILSCVMAMTTVHTCQSHPLAILDQRFQTVQLERAEAMPNGYSVDAYCNYCGVWAPCHRRSDEDYMYWIGLFCDACMDWIDDNDELWMRHRLLQAAQWRLVCRARCATRGHCLIQLLETDGVAELIAEMVVDYHGL